MVRLALGAAAVFGTTVFLPLSAAFGLAHGDAKVLASSESSANAAESSANWWKCRCPAGSLSLDHCKFGNGFIPNQETCWAGINTGQIAHPGPCVPASPGLNDCMLGLNGAAGNPYVWRSMTGVQCCNCWLAVNSAPAPPPAPPRPCPARCGQEFCKGRPVPLNNRGDCTEYCQDGFCWKVPAQGEHYLDCTPCKTPYGLHGQQGDAKSGGARSDGSRHLRSGGPNPPHGEHDGDGASMLQIGSNATLAAEVAADEGGAEL